MRLKYILHAIGFGLLGLVALVFTRFNLFRLGWRRHNTAWYDLSFLHIDWIFQTQEPYWRAHIQNLGWFAIGLLMFFIAVAFLVRSLRKIQAPAGGANAVH